MDMTVHLNGSPDRSTEESSNEGTVPNAGCQKEREGSLAMVVVVVVWKCVTNTHFFAST